MEKDWLSALLGWQGAEAERAGAIGKAHSKSGETLFQRRGEFAWNPVQSSVDLARRDGILTGQNAQSELVFEDGLALLLGPNTWVEVDRSQSGTGMHLKLRHGSVRITKASSLPLSIELGGGAIEVAPHSLIELNESKLQVRGGSAVLKRAQSPDVRVGETESLDFEPGQAQVRFDTAMLSITRPQIDAPCQGEALNVTWKVQRHSPLEAPMRVELSRSQNFETTSLMTSKTIPLSEPVPSQVKIALTLSHLAHTSGLRSGDWVYLRIVSRNQGKEIASPTVRLHWEKKSPPPPPEDFDLEIERKKPRSSIRSWMDYFGKLLIPEAHAETSEMEETPETPREVIEGEEAQVVVKWRPVEGADAYRIQASDSDTFTRVLAEETVHTPMWKWIPPIELLKAQLFFRIASVSSDGQLGGFSRARKIALPVVVPPPAFSMGAQLHTGVGNFIQFGGNSGLSGVQGVWPYFQQKLSAEFRLSRESDQFALETSGTIAGFHKPATTPTTLQPDQIAGTLAATLLRHSAARRSQGLWSWAVGLGADWSYRWYKTNIQVVEPHYAFSVGPAAALMRNWQGRETGWGRLIPRNSEFKLRLPLSGLLTQGNWGLVASAAAEWKLYSKRRIQISLRAETETSWMRFQDSSGASVLALAFWLAPVLQWGAP